MRGGKDSEGVHSLMKFVLVILMDSTALEPHYGAVVNEYLLGL